VCDGLITRCGVQEHIVRLLARRAVDAAGLGLEIARKLNEEVLKRLVILSRFSSH
jgi:hypothetical protein